MSPSEIKKKLKTLTLKVESQNKEISNLKDVCSQAITQIQNMGKAMQQWEKHIKTSSQITHGMAIATNILMDKGIITAEELEAKSSKMQADHEEIKRAERVAQDQEASS